MAASMSGSDRISCGIWCASRAFAEELEVREGPVDFPINLLRGFEAVGFAFEDEAIGGFEVAGEDMVNSVLSLSTYAYLI